MSARVVTINLTNPKNSVSFDGAEIYVVGNQSEFEQEMADVGLFYMEGIPGCVYSSYDSDAYPLIDSIDSPNDSTAVEIDLSNYSTIMILFKSNVSGLNAGSASCTGGVSDTHASYINGNIPALLYYCTVTGDGTLTIDGIDYDE